MTSDLEHLLSKHNWKTLANASDTQLQKGMSVILGEGSERLDILLIAVDGTVKAYQNDCPHAHTTLENILDEFLDKEDPDFIVCSTHGARFRKSDGYCIKGPCKGKSLTPVNVEMKTGEIVLVDRPKHLHPSIRSSGQ